MYAVTYQRLVGGAQTERATAYYPTAPAARKAARRAIEAARPGATMQAKTRPRAGVAWTPRLRQEADTFWREPYYLWPARVTIQLTGLTHLSGDQTAVVVTRVTLEPVDTVDRWEPFTLAAASSSDEANHASECGK